MKKKIIIVLAIVVLLTVGFFVFRNSKITSQLTEKSSLLSKKTVLTYAVHWTNKDQVEDIYENGILKSKGLKHYLDEYTKLNPNIEFKVQTINYNEYANTLRVLSDSDMAPDIYQIYSNWGVSYVKDGLLATPPEDVISDVKTNYISTAGVTINGQIWGIPTEINNFVLLYNKDLFKAAGLVDKNGNVVAPKTWNELVSYASKLTKKDSKGNITQYGIAFNNEDWQVVDPFLSLLYSNGGKYLSSDLSKSLFNSVEGVQALEAELQLFKKGATDTNGNFYDFGKGTVGMVIAPPWTKAGFKSNFGTNFEKVVGVAPIPYLKTPASTGYSWFMGVMEKSKNKEESWKFLRWLTEEIQTETGTTRYGDLLANSIGSIPARKVDFESHKEVLGDFFTKVYVDQMKNTISEPNVFDSSYIKNILLKEIQSAWAGSKTASQALSSASLEIDKILQSK